MGVSHLYRLTVKPDNTVRVDIDQEKIYEGSLKEDWELLEAKEISDPDDKKPSDWVEDSMMDDPEDKKPADWVEEKRVGDEARGLGRRGGRRVGGADEGQPRLQGRVVREAHLEPGVQGLLGGEEDREPCVRGRS